MRLIRRCLRYVCKGYDYGEKADLSEGYWDPKRKMWVTAHFSEKIKTISAQRSSSKCKNEVTKKILAALSHFENR